MALKSCRMSIRGLIPIIGDLMYLGLPVDKVGHGTVSVTRSTTHLCDKAIVKYQGNEENDET